MCFQFMGSLDPLRGRSISRMVEAPPHGSPQELPSSFRGVGQGGRQGPVHVGASQVPLFPAVTNNPEVIPNNTGPSYVWRRLLYQINSKGPSPGFGDLRVWLCWKSNGGPRKCLAAPVRLRWAPQDGPGPSRTRAHVGARPPIEGGFHGDDVPAACDERIAIDPDFCTLGEVVGGGQY